MRGSKPQGDRHQARPAGRAAEDKRREALLSVGELAKLFEPMGYQGVAQTFIDRIVGALQVRAGKR